MNENTNTTETEPGLLGTMDLDNGLLAYAWRNEQGQVGIFIDTTAYDGHDPDTYEWPQIFVVLNDACVYDGYDQTIMPAVWSDDSQTWEV